MLPQKHRFLLKQDYSSVWIRGKIKESDSFFLKFKRNDLRQLRFGIIVNSQTTKLASKRNLLKRRIAGILRAFLLKNNTLPWDIIIKTKPAIIKKKFPEIEKELGELLANITKQQ